MSGPKVTLDQWRVLQAVVDCGGYARAAEQLHRSQSALSYGVAKLQERLGTTVLEVDGRKARLTPAGEVLLGRSRQLLADALALERLATNLEQGWEPEIKLVVDAAFPSCHLMNALKRFAPHSRGSRVLLNEVVLSGADEALLEGRADIAICAQPPKGFLGDALVEVEFVAVAHRDHPLHRLGRELTSEDLRREMQVVIRDSGLYLKRDTGWLGAEHRWTVTSLDKALEALISGLGFGWLPRHQVQVHLDSGTLRALPLREGQSRFAWLYMIFGRTDNIGPASRMLADILTEVCQVPGSAGSCT